MGRQIFDTKSVGLPPEFISEMHQMSPGMHYEDNRTVFLAGDFNEFSISNVIQNIFFHAQRDANKPIYLVIQSYGGETHAMFSLYDAMKYVKCPIHTIGLGAIMSASVLILSAGEKGHRKVGANTRVMLHSVAGVNAGNVFEQKNQFEEMERVQKRMTKLLAKECNKDYEIFKKLMEKGYDQYLSAKKALKLGIVDQIF